jgi:hypothetical protein
MCGTRRKKMLSMVVMTVLGASTPPPVAAQLNSPDPAQRAVAMQNMRACMAELGRANQAGATNADRAQVLRGCAAREGKTFQPTGMQQGVELEQAGRYAEAAAEYQAHLNASGHPDGDGYVAGERIGYLYANGRGVPRDVARARALFSANSLDRNRIDLILLNNNLLPAAPELKTPALVEKANAIVAEEQRKAIEKQRQAEAEENRRQQAWNAAHPEVVRARQQCQTSCAQAVQECNRRNLGMNWGTPFGAAHEREYDCPGLSWRCSAQCN